MAPSRYTVEIDLTDVNKSHTLAILEVPVGSTVLDVGAADGAVARQLRERGCKVTAIEIDPEAAARAGQYCERVIVGDVEALDLEAELGGQQFDFVLLLDVLEHLRDPLATLRAVAARLTAAGRLIMSVPNVTHAALRLKLLGGRFEYTETGLLDKTHLHLFDRHALERLIADAELTVVDRMRTTAGVTGTEVEVDPESFPPETVALALSGEDAETYQFVYVVAPAAGATRPAEVRTPSLGEALQARAIHAERLRAEAEAYVHTLEERLAELERGRDEALAAHEQADARAEELERELRRRLSELETEHEDLRHAKLDIAVKDAQLAQLQAELAPIRARLDRAEEMLGYARHRLVERVSAATKRMPVVHRTLKRAVERAADRK